MGVYINMEMPTDRPQLLWVYPNGKALTIQSDVDPWKELQAIPVQPHGRLGDLDKLHKAAVRRSEKAWGYDSCWYNCNDRVISAFDIEIAPTIIPADADEERREYDAQVEAAKYCEMYEPTYDPETGAM